MKNNTSIKNILIQEYGNKCSICGKEFNEENPSEIDHIIPCSRGGSDELYNLQLTCRRCNRGKRDMFIPQEVFESYIQKVIEKSQKYQIIKVKNDYDMGIDLIIRDKEVYKLCETKMETTFTTTRINNIVRLFKEREIEFAKRYNKVASLLIFPGEISNENVKILQDNNIEVWDREYLKEEFKKEILEINNPYLDGILNFFGKEKDASEKEYVKEIDKKLVELEKCESGNANWGNYQKLVGEILEVLFCPSLERSIVESYDYSKANRRDFIMPNYSENGFWKFLRENYLADFIVIDAKNSQTGVTKKDILQVANYLKKHGTGLFGMIVGRKYDTKKLESTLREQWILYNKMIIILEDKDIEQMLLQKRSCLEAELVIRQKIEDFRVSI